MTFRDRGVVVGYTAGGQPVYAIVDPNKRDRCLASDRPAGTPRAEELSMPDIEPEQDLINGYPVIASARIPDREGMRPNMRVIMVDRERDFQRYVVSTACAGLPGWFQGYYTGSLADARAKFNELWERYVRDEQDD